MAKGDDRFRPYPAGGVGPIKEQHPLVNPNRPADEEIENENRPALGRGDRALAQQRVASGGLADDPTASGDPVRNRRSFAGLKGGR